MLSYKSRDVILELLDSSIGTATNNLSIAREAAYNNALSTQVPLDKLRTRLWELIDAKQELLDWSKP